MPASGHFAAEKSHADNLLIHVPQRIDPGDRFLAQDSSPW